MVKHAFLLVDQSYLAHKSQSFARTGQNHADMKNIFLYHPDTCTGNEWLMRNKGLKLMVMVWGGGGWKGGGPGDGENKTEKPSAGPYLLESINMYPNSSIRAYRGKK